MRIRKAVRFEDDLLIVRGHVSSYASIARWPYCYASPQVLNLNFNSTMNNK